MAILCMVGCSRETVDTLEVFGEGQANQVDSHLVPDSATAVRSRQGAGTSDLTREALLFPNPLGLLGIDVATSECDFQNDAYDTCI